MRIWEMIGVFVIVCAFQNLNDFLGYTSITRAFQNLNDFL